MGTSVSQRSPDTHNWRAVSASYLSEKLSIERVSQEIWRAATNQLSGNLPLSLADPIIARCLKTAIDSNSVQEAAYRVSRLVAESGEASLATDLARRATVVGFTNFGDRGANFVKSLFSETVDYLISRDLPGYVGQGNRIKDISSLIAFKESIKKHVETTVNNSPASEDVYENAERWRTYVTSQIGVLTNR